MEKQVAEFLADTIVKQFVELPLEVEKAIPIEEKRQQLVDILEASKVWNDPKKMQFETSTTDTIDAPAPGRYTLQHMALRRIFTTYDTDYMPENAPLGWLVEWWQSGKERLYDSGISRYDAEVMGRVLRRNNPICLMRSRNQLIAQLIRANESNSSGEIKRNGFDYGIIAHFVNTLDVRGKHGGDVDVHIPLIFMPAATKDDLQKLGFCKADAERLGLTASEARFEREYLSRFTVPYQRPSHDSCFGMVKKYKGILKDEICNHHIPVEDFLDYWDVEAMQKQNRPSLEEG